MFTHCFVCNTAFPQGKLVEHFPLARRIAYDPERGRLWAVCEACGGWTLAPFAERWEALEELERLVTGRGRERGRMLLAGQTDNVSLFKSRTTEVIRVGRTALSEEAWWRYGRPSRVLSRGRVVSPFAPRRLRTGEWILGAAFFLRSSLTSAAPSMPDIRRWVRFGSVAWSGKERCAACGHPIQALTYVEGRTLILKHEGGEGVTPSLIRACPRCHDEVSGGLHLEGSIAELVLRRVLAYQHDGGTSLARIFSAIALIEGGGGGAGLSAILSRYGRYLGELPRTSAVALRILADEARERRLMALNTAELDFHWRRAEELAAIVDGELTQFPRLEATRHKIRGR